MSFKRLALVYVNIQTDKFGCSFPLAKKSDAHTQLNGFSIRNTESQHN